MAARDDSGSLVAALLRGEEAAWRRFLDAYGPVIAQAARRALGTLATPALLDEIVAEVMAALLERDRRLLRQFRGDASLATWVWTLGRTAAHRRLRALRKEEGRVPLEGLEVPAAQEDPEALGRLSRALALLPERSRLALRMAYWEEKPYARIGEALGISAESVGPLLKRAKQELLEIMTGSGSGGLQQGDEPVP